MDKTIIDEIMDPDRIVIYKCPKGHVSGITLKEAQSGNVRCNDCIKEKSSIKFFNNVDNILKIL